MRHHPAAPLLIASLVVPLALAGCGGGGGRHASATPAPSSPAAQAIPPTPSGTPTLKVKRAYKPFSAGNPGGHASVPAEARPADVSHPATVIGKGGPRDCTSAAVVAAVAKGGVITFDCGPKPVTITMTATARVVNSRARVVLDGGGLVTLSGAGRRRVLYMNTCDKALGWTTSHCNDQSTPHLTVQRIAFSSGNSTGEKAEGGGGGAVFVRGGRFNIAGARFTGNRCDSTGPDLGGAAVRVLDQYHGLPVYVVGSTFAGGVCSNGGALSSIGVSWSVLNSVLTGNQAIGRGANPARGGTPGGGSGGAIYADGNRFTVRVAGSVVTGNRAAEGGGAIFFVSNDLTGTLALESSRLTGNPSAGFQTAGLPGVFYRGSGRPHVSGTTLR
ncbi:hypothetical protein J4573_44065 [Actinomadura barringtoniae]|uniref:Right-handed parallel beta-helix repeat-containing protein n=1 Tax=Actinomadura barringtoniae TaxID=1427535 RepID=A0A939PS72_9ACTN|nr:hypothetical protein [Actinomadura barringtoniae]MBO2454129.1 hypothetical protein [Actinomadura barringtoniae]